jgi:ring-1,2-phenylacetyl-CoA epoxidase subunit PaaE
VSAGVEFHALEVAAVDRLTEDAVAVTFDVPHDLAERFRYLPGQHVTVKAEIDGADVRRSYSVCADATVGMLRVGIKRLEGGAFSTYATSRLRPGDRVDVMPPVGEFTIAPDPERGRHYGAVAAGSGITPVLSLMSTTLAAEPRSEWTLVFGNRGASSIMFLDEVEGLKDRYPERLQLVHVLSREQPDLDLFAGRIDRPKLDALFETVVPFEAVDEWFLCGPFEMVVAAREALEERGVAPELVHDELFFAGPGDPRPEADGHEYDGPVALSLSIGGRTLETRMSPEMSILDAASRVREGMPYSCKGGMCATCKAKVVDGEVRMDRNYALVESELEAGYVLTCQAHPLGDRVAVDYDV